MTRRHDALTLIAFVAGLLCVMGTARADEIGTVLDRIDTPGFSTAVPDEKGYKAVRETIQAQPEVKWLLERPGESVARIVKRIEAGNIKNPATLCAYFLVLELSGDRAAVPVLLDYIESVPQAHNRTRCAPLSPFRHAAEAIGGLIGLGDIIRDDRSLCWQMDLRREGIGSWVRELLEQADGSEWSGGVEATLDRTDGGGEDIKEDCFFLTYFCSGYGSFRRVILGTVEVRYLAARPRETVPRIVQRIEEGRVNDPTALCAYFLILELCGDRGGLPVLLNYVESLPATERKNVGAPSHPFNYAVEAIYALAHLGPFPPKTKPPTLLAPYGLFQRLFLRRGEIVAKARAVLEKNN